MFVALFFVSHSVLFAGGELSEEELLKHTKRCRPKGYGDSCLVLAEETMCGRGFNEETYSYMSKACSAFAFQCDKQVSSACKDLFFRCFIPCIGDDLSEEKSIGMGFDVGEYIDPNLAICAYASMEQNELTTMNQKMVSYFSTNCVADNPTSCRILADLYEATHLDQSIVYWKKGCEFNDPMSCMKLGNHWRDMGTEMEKRACLLDEQQNKQFRHRYRYRKVCEEYRKLEK